MSALILVGTLFLCMFGIWWEARQDIKSGRQLSLDEPYQ